MKLFLALLASMLAIGAISFWAWRASPVVTPCEVIERSTSRSADGRVQADVFEQPDLVHRLLDDGLGRRTAVLRDHVLLERACVGTDADGHAERRGLPADQRHLVVLLDVAGVDPDPLAPGFERGQRVLPLEVDVGDDRDRRFARDHWERLDVVGIGNRDADDVAAARRQRRDLLQRRVEIGGLRRAHRLDADRRVAADGNGADVDLLGLPALDHTIKCSGAGMRPRRAPIRGSQGAAGRYRGTTATGTGSRRY